MVRFLMSVDSLGLFGNACLTCIYVVRQYRSTCKVPF
jgi:hypothetical protein